MASNPWYRRGASELIGTRTDARHFRKSGPADADKRLMTRCGIRADEIRVSKPHAAARGYCFHRAIAAGAGSRPGGVRTCPPVPGLRRIPDGWRGASPAGYPPPPYPYPPPRHTTSGWAIAAFLLGFLSCVPLSVIFGIIALVKTKDGRQRGRGLAIAGMAISGLWVVGLIAALAALHFTSLVAGTVESGESLMVGQCVDETPQSEAAGAEVGARNLVGCDQPHSDEVFAVLSVSRFPETESDHNELVNRCTAELRSIRRQRAATRRCGLS